MEITVWYNSHSKQWKFHIDGHWALDLTLSGVAGKWPSGSWSPIHGILIARLSLTIIWAALDNEVIEGSETVDAVHTISSTIAHSSGVSLKTLGRENQKKSSKASSREDHKHVVVLVLTFAVLCVLCFDDAFDKQIRSWELHYFFHSSFKARTKTHKGI